LRLHLGPAPQGGAQLRGGLSAPRGVCRVRVASWDQLVALRNLPHTHTHTPLLCCRLPLQEQRQQEDACVLHRSTRGEQWGRRPAPPSGPPGKTGKREPARA